MEYFFNWDDKEKATIGGDYSSAFGSFIEGKRMLVAIVHKDKGTGSRLHSHPNEQFNYILQGRFDVKVDDEEKIVGPGELVYIPADTPHYVIAVSDGGGDYYVTKDASWGIAGAAVDGKKTGAHYEPGHEIDK